MKKAFISYPQKLMDCYTNLEYIIRSRKKCSDCSEIESNFVKSTYDILELIKNEFIAYSDKAEASEMVKKSNRSQDSRSIKLQVLKKAVIDSDKQHNKSENDHKNEQKSNQDIYKEFRDFLNKKKNKYKSDYISLYDQYWDYIKHEQQILIDELYNFKD